MTRFRALAVSSVLVLGGCAVDQGASPGETVDPADPLGS